MRAVTNVRTKLLIILNGADVTLRQHTLGCENVARKKGEKGCSHRQTKPTCILKTPVKATTHLQSRTANYRDSGGLNRDRATLSIGICKGLNPQGALLGTVHKARLLHLALPLGTHSFKGGHWRDTSRKCSLCPPSLSRACPQPPHCCQNQRRKLSLKQEGQVNGQETCPSRSKSEVTEQSNGAPISWPGSPKVEESWNTCSGGHWEAGS